MQDILQENVGFIIDFDHKFSEKMAKSVMRLSFLPAIRLFGHFFEKYFEVGLKKENFS